MKQTNSSLAKVCYTCGDIGVEECISACFKCKINYEHTYCRKSFPQNRQAEWYCDDCEKDTVALPKDAKEGLESPLVSKPSAWVYDEGTSSRLNAEQRRKVKSIPVEEVMKMTSGSLKEFSRVKTAKRSNPPSTIVRPMCLRTPIPRKTPPYSPVILTPSPAIRQNHYAIQREGNVSKGKKVRFADSVAAMAPGGAKDATVPPIRPGHQVSGDLDSRVSQIKNSAVKSMECEAKIHSSGPAHRSSWRGHFEVQGGMFKNIKSCFKAHPRFKVHQNVVDTLSTMPKLLQLEMIHRKMVWAELFQDQFADEDDIGLYLFPGERKRSDYDFLLEFMGAKDLAMRGNILGVELFLFTSKILFGDSKKLDAEYYIWGVFRKPIKQKLKLVSKLYEELSEVHHQVLDSAENNDTVNDDCAVDMEIDMVDGKDVGRIDIAVPRDYPRGTYSSEGHVNSVEIRKEPSDDFPPGFEDMIRQNIKKEPLEDFPPGFEDMIRQNMKKI